MHRQNVYIIVDCYSSLPHVSFQGFTYHWTLSSGFSIAEATNFLPSGKTGNAQTDDQILEQHIALAASELELLKPTCVTSLMQGPGFIPGFLGHHSVLTEIVDKLRQPDYEAKDQPGSYGAAHVGRKRKM